MEIFPVRGGGCPRTFHPADGAGPVQVPGEVACFQGEQAVREGSDLTIGRLAKAVGVPISTIRYYEREGLLAADSRTAGNYRLYGGAALERLRFIRTAQDNGFSLEDIRLLLAARAAPPGTCEKVQERINARLAELDQRLRDIRRFRATLRRWLAACRTSAPTGRCAVVQGLARQSARGG
jgi:MerR family mercuric resistance operon transcriptional regulator